MVCRKLFQFTLKTCYPYWDISQLHHRLHHGLHRIGAGLERLAGQLNLIGRKGMSLKFAGWELLVCMVKLSLQKGPQFTYFR